MALGCESSDKEGETSLSDIAKEAKDVVSASKNYAMQKKDDAQKELSDQVDELRKDVERLKAKVGQVDSEVPGTLTEKIRAIEGDIATLEKQTSEIKTASDTAWTEIKLGIEKARESLDGALEKAAGQFKGKKDDAT